MPQNESITKLPYVIGMSFRNPRVVKPVTHTNMRPYFAMDWAAKGPSETKEELYSSGQLRRYPTVWRRAAKAMTIEKLGDKVLNRKELPSFEELGAAPGPTDLVSTTSTTSRGAWGFLDNLIKSTGEIIAQRQQLDIVKAQAQAQAAQQYPTMLPTFYTPGEGGGIGMLGWMTILGGLGVGAYYFMRKS